MDPDDGPAIELRVLRVALLVALAIICSVIALGFALELARP